MLDAISGPFKSILMVLLHTTCTKVAPQCVGGTKVVFLPCEKMEGILGKSPSTNTIEVRHPEKKDSTVPTEAPPKISPVIKTLPLPYIYLQMVHVHLPDRPSYKNQSIEAGLPLNHICLWFLLSPFVFFSKSSWSPFNSKSSPPMAHQMITLIELSKEVPILIVNLTLMEELLERPTTMKISLWDIAMLGATSLLLCRPWKKSLRISPRLRLLPEPHIPPIVVTESSEDLRNWVPSKYEKE
ncbi:hypothetical protein AMTR_s00119p00037510 [Amborella trichopoda]|uniref:Uncharacterized protein n=1 Tax=Amborella trichopoda TaxID=13333 RepID=W1NNG1_AMBTC|nr:hypothetical protein AMTR_s00119p00037510 [Amborella trichopoda]